MKNIDIGPFIGVVLLIIVGVILVVALTSNPSGVMSFGQSLIDSSFDTQSLVAKNILAIIVVPHCFS